MPMIPQTMRAVVIAAPGGPEALVVAERPMPVPGDGEVLVRVHAAGVNRPDIIQREGRYPPPPGAPADIPGLEIAGEVAALGPGAQRFAVGDEVTALLPGGGYAEYATVHATNALPVPAGLTMVQAAAIPETFFTVWSNLFDRARLAAGETVLIHGGASGIGTAAIQLAKAFGATVIVTAGSDARCAACIALGANAAINYRSHDFVVEVKRLTDGRGANVILDMVGGDYVGRNYAAAAEDGRVVQIAFLRGSRVEADFRLLMVKRLVHTGSTLRPRPVAAKAAIARALEDKVWPLIAAGTVAPVVDSQFPLERAADAHRRMESGQHVGKIMLAVVT